MRLEFLSFALVIGIISTAHADVDRTPARTIIHHVITTPTTSNLKAVRTDTDEDLSIDHYYIGVDPNEDMFRHPNGIPQGTVRENTDQATTSLPPCSQYSGTPCAK